MSAPLDDLASTYVPLVPEVGFGNASIAGKLCFAVKGGQCRVNPSPAAQWNCPGRVRSQSPTLGTSGKLRRMEREGELPKIARCTLLAAA